MTAPCGSCPWRRGAKSESIPNFDSNRATCSLPQVAGDTDGFRPIMACHLSDEGGDRPCVGYVVSDDGWRNLTVRMAVIDGRIDLDAMREAAEWIDLYSTFEEMLTALVPTRRVLG